MAGMDEGTAPVAYTLTAEQERYLRVKRGLDCALASLLIILLSVPMAVIALSLKLLSPGEPVLFRHRRVGENGELFELVKFRSMKGGTSKYVASADLADSGAHITRFGRFLRGASLDELPQLFHVLSGKMSLIGPRPLIPQEREIHALRMAAGVYRLRPGLTGWAQINGRDRVTAREKAELDRQYLENISFRLDWKIFWITIGKVLSGADVRQEPERDGRGGTKGARM